MGKQINMDGSMENVAGNDKVLKANTTRINKKGKVTKNTVTPLIETPDKDIEFQIKKQEFIDSINEYNRKTDEVSEEVANIKLIGNSLLIKLYKHNPFTESGLHQPIMTQEETAGGKVRTVESPLQYLPYGTIVNMSGEYSKGFAERFKVGDKFTLRNGLALQQLMFFLDIPKLMTSGSGILANFEGIFKINENMIENGFKNK